jgi:hypothetical protein
MEIDYFYRDAEHGQIHPPELDFDEQNAVDNMKQGIFEDLKWQLSQKEIHSFDDMRNAVTEYPVDETAVMDLSADQEISLIERYTEEFGLALERIVPDNLRRIIESTATQVVSQLAESAAFETIDRLYFPIKTYRSNRYAIVSVSQKAPSINTSVPPINFCSEEIVVVE